MPADTVKHTPGPWKVIEGPFISVITEWTVVDDDDPSSATYHTIVHDCDYDGWVDLSVPRSNACLIAAAPELLSVAKRILDRGYVSESIEEERADHLALAAAVAKAEGRS